MHQAFKRIHRGSSRCISSHLQDSSCGKLLSWLQSELHTSSPVVTLGNQSYIGMKGPCPKFWSHSVSVEHFFEVQTNLGSYISDRSPNYPISRHEDTNFQPAGFWSIYTQTTNLFPARMTLPGFAKGLVFRNSKTKLQKTNLLAAFVVFDVGTTNMETTVGWMRFFGSQNFGTQFLLRCAWCLPFYPHGTLFLSFVFANHVVRCGLLGPKRQEDDLVEDWEQGPTESKNPGSLSWQ